MAKKHPEVVDDLLTKYENWFDEVTEERDAKGIQRIYLGNPNQPNVNLSRFDWGGPRVLSKNQLGHWRVKTESGLYEISVDLPVITSDGVAHIKYNNLHITLPITKNLRKVVFKNVKLPDDIGNFHVYLKTERLASGPLFVDVNRLDF